MGVHGDGQPPQKKDGPFLCAASELVLLVLKRHTYVEMYQSQYRKKMARSRHICLLKTNNATKHGERLIIVAAAAKPCPMALPRLRKIVTAVAFHLPVVHTD